MAPQSKANYKSYEAQARMIRAIVAAHPDVKWNYKEIVACYGSDMTDHALNHRFRHWRAEALLIRLGREKGFDMKNLESDEKKLPKTQDSIDKKNIAKYFGQSTGDGMQFQFRSIKKDAEKLRQVVKAGGDPSSCLSLGGGVSAGPPITPRKQAAFNTGNSRSGSQQKRQHTMSIKETSSEDDAEHEEEEDTNWSERDETPSKRARTGPAPGQKNGTPSRRAAVKAAVTIADATAELDSSESPPEILTPSSSAPLPQPALRAAAPPPPTFGNIDRKPAFPGPPPDDPFHPAFTGMGRDEYFGGSGIGNSMYSSSFYPDAGEGDDFDGDGEI